ncbi:photosystem II reaction center W protein, chloroplastic [Andrographis paniculata]|uniref:photosystem II reaction center W protein, chloroplastic n=1 Tax=Andrographis paniculata TaxID=175694 RepID=UPI0021E817F4|nr:photosystem II reaction center W protein, chloroplastic [Andrographis paniculata]
MATLSACTSTSSVPRAAFVGKLPAARPSAVLGLPSMRKTAAAAAPGGVRCAAVEEKAETKVGMGAGSLMAAACAAAMSSPAAVALVDERMSTEGTGLPFGLSNNLLIWIIIGVFALIWALYTVYALGLDEDEDAGLSL